MRVKALKKFNDLLEGTMREPNTKTALFDCTKQRYEEIVSKLGDDFLEVVEEKKTKK